ncbi:MAG: beta strand repeat-containing protein, partial [Acetobacteraceae bacterium]
MALGGLIAIAQGAAPAQAQSCTWNTGSGSWNTAADWSTCNATFPGTGASTGSDATVNGATVTLSIGSLSVGALTIGNSSAGEVDVTGSSATNNSFSSITVNANSGFVLENGAAVTTTGGFSNSGNTYVDYFGGEGGSTLNVGGTLTNSNTLNIGNTGLSANTVVTAQAADNTGTIALTGTATEQATLAVAGAAGFGTAGTVTGTVSLQGDSLVQFGSGGLTSVASSGDLSLIGAGSRVSIGPGTTNSALTGLASNAGYFVLGNAASVTTTGGFGNSGNTYVDYFGGEGGSTFNVGGTLTNSNTLNIGNTGLSANTVVTAQAAANTGTIALTGTSTDQAALKIAGAAGFGTAGTVTGTVSLEGDSLVQFGSGGLTSVASGGDLSLIGAGSRVSIGPGTTNSALTGLASNAGYFVLGNGAAVTTTGGFGNSGNTWVDYLGGEGGSTLNVGGTLTNSNTLNIGNTGLSANTVVTAQAADNTGTIALTGTSTNQAALKIAGAAGFGTAGTVTGAVNLQGDTLLQFGSGGLTSVASGGQLALNGADAQVQIAGNSANNNALTGLASNAGYFVLGNGAEVTTTGGFGNSGSTYVDYLGGEGGSTLNVGSTLTNSNTLNIGNNNLSAAANVTAASLDNTSTGTIDLFGTSPNVATLTVNGPASTAGNVNVNAYGSLNVAGGNNYTQTAGTTTLAANGTLGAANVAINGGTLQGNGTVTGNVFNSATITGGINGQPGTLTINGNFQNAGNGGSAFGSTPGTVATYLAPSGNTAITVASGSPTLNGGTIQGNAVGGLNYAAGQTFTVMNFTPGSLTGVFGLVQNGNASATLGTSTSLPGNLTLGVVYNDHAGNIQLEVVNTPTSTTDTWNGGTGTWSTASGWSAGVPQFFSNVGIGATSSGNVTLNQDATIQSLGINAGNTLVYQATTPATLSVGGAVTVAGGGTLDLPTSGDKLALGGNFFNSGTTTLGAGASLYGLGTFTNNGGTATIGNGASVTTLGAASNGSGASIALAGGSLTAPSFTNAGTVSGFGTVNPAIANTGLVQASGGTLTAANGVQGATGNITVGGGATLDLSHSAAGSSAATLAQNGALNLGSQNLTVSTDYSNANFGTGNSFDKRSGVTGTGQILAAGTVSQAVSGSDVSDGTTASPTLAFGNVHVGTTNNATYEIGNTGTSGPALRGAIQTSTGGGNITDASLSGGGVTAQNFGPVATGSSTSPYTVTYAPTASGALAGQAVHIANNFANVGEQTLGITGAAYNYANPTVASSLSPAFNFGVVQAGQTYTDPLTISNVLVGSSAAYQEGLNAAFGSITNPQLTGSGSITNLAAGQSNASAMTVTLKPVTAGATSGTVTLNFASNGAGTSGLGITALPSQNLDYVWAFSGVVVNPASPSITPNPVAFGNVRIKSSQSQALSVENVATTAPQASLDAQVGTVSGAATSNNLSSISQLAAGSTDKTSFVLGLNTASAGARSGSAVINLQSDSTPNGCTSNCIVNLPSDTVAVSGNVYRLADPTLNTSSVNLAARVGATAAPTANVSVTNTSPDAYTEGLAASFGATPAGFSASGSITNLGAQGTDNSSLNVALNTATAGTFTGNSAINFVSNGQIDNAAPISVGSANVALTGKVYTPAQATVNTASPVDFGIVHVGDGGGALSRSISVSNSAPVTALNDTLLGGIGTSGSP